MSLGAARIPLATSSALIVTTDCRLIVAGHRGSVMAAAASDLIVVYVVTICRTSAGWLSAFIEGSRHLAPGDDAGAPADLAWAALDGCAMAVFVGRGHSTFLRRERDQLALLGRWLTFLAGSSEVPGSALLPTAVQALALHWATGQSGAEDAHLGSLLAWIESGARAAREAEAGPVAGPATDPEFDNYVLAPLISGGDPSLPAVLRELLLPTWQRMWRAIDLLRALGPGSRVAARWDAARDAYSAYVEHLNEDGAPQPRRDGAVAAAARLQRLENAAARYAVQRAFDDPLKDTAVGGLVLLCGADLNAVD